MDDVITTVSYEAEGLAFEVDLRRSPIGFLYLTWELIKGSDHPHVNDYMWECFERFCKEQRTTERIHMLHGMCTPRAWEGGSFRRATIRDTLPVAPAYEVMVVVRLWVQGFTEADLLDYLDHVATEWPKEEVIDAWRVLGQRARWHCGLELDEAREQGGEQ